MIEYALYAVLGILLLNLVAATAVSLRRVESNHWLLTLLLASTSAAALAAVSAVLLDDARVLDVALVFTATAAVTAAVRLAARRRRIQPDAGDGS